MSETSRALAKDELHKRSTPGDMLLYRPAGAGVARSPVVAARSPSVERRRLRPRPRRRTAEITLGAPLGERGNASGRRSAKPCGLCPYAAGRRSGESELVAVRFAPEVVREPFADALGTVEGLHSALLAAGLWPERVAVRSLLVLASTRRSSVRAPEPLPLEGPAERDRVGGLDGPEGLGG